MGIGLGDTIPGCKNFLWAEALWLPSAKFHAYPNEEQWGNIIKVASKLQYVRDYYRKPVRIHSWLRPDFYNAFIGGAPSSQHRLGAAVDFSVISEEVGIEDIRKMLEPKLEQLKIRMELNTPAHVHIDIKEVGKWESRTFYPR